MKQIQISEIGKMNVFLTKIPSSPKPEKDLPEVDFAQIFGDTNSENTHSNWLAQILGFTMPGEDGRRMNPVLDALTKELGLEWKFDADSVNIQREYNIGSVDGEHGGRIDILITDHERHALAIENKVNAADQPLQLCRYHNYLKETYPGQYALLYLTRDDVRPSAESMGSAKFPISRINYCQLHDILKTVLWEVVTHDDAFARTSILKIYLNTLDYMINPHHFSAEDKDVAKVAAEHPLQIANILRLAPLIMRELRQEYVLKPLREAFPEAEIANHEVQYYPGITISLPHSPYIIFIGSAEKDYLWANMYIAITKPYDYEGETLPMQTKLPVFISEPTENCPYGYTYLGGDWGNWSNLSEPLISDMASDKLVNELISLVKKIFEQYSQQETSNQSGQSNQSNTYTE